MKKRKINNAARKALELLEDRRLMSAVSLSGSNLQLLADSGRGNSFLIRAASEDRVLAFANNTGLVEADSAVSQVVVYTGNKADTVIVNSDVVTPVEVIDPAGKVTWLNAGTTTVFSPAAAAQDNSGTTTGGSSLSGGDTTTGKGTDKSSPGSTGTSGGTSDSGNSNQNSGQSGSHATSISGKTADGTNAVITFTSSQSIYAGLSVHVNALSSTLGAGTVLNATYNWDFGDAGSQYDQLVGYVGAHQYTTPGTFTVTLTITDSNGQSSVTTGQVTVLSTSALRTIYVSPTGYDGNSGATPSQPIQSVTQLNSLLGSNTIVYFENGGTYDLTQGINVNHFQNVEITSYGSGAQPILMYNGGYQHSDMVAIQSASDGILVNGLTFDSIYKNNQDANAIPTAIGIQGNDINVTNCTFYNVDYDTDMSLQPTNVLVQNNTSPDPTALNGYFAWVQGSDISIIGNTVANSVGESLIRVGGANDILIADNTLSNIADAGGDTNDIVKATIAIQEGNYAYVYGNTIGSGPVGVGPLGVGNYLNSPTSQFSYCVFDSNYISDTLLFQPNSFHSMAKNNVLFSNGTVGGFAVNSTQGTWQAQDIYIMHNTVFDSGSTGSFLDIYHGEAEGITVDSNVFAAPNFQTGAGQGLIVDNNNDLASFSEINANVWALPSPSSWANGGFFYVDSNAGVQAGYLTPKEWEALPLGSGGYATNDTYENVNLGYTNTVNSVTAGSNLLNSDLASAA